MLVIADRLGEWRTEHLDTLIFPRSSIVLIGFDDELLFSETYGYVQRNDLFAAPPFGSNRHVASITEAHLE